MALSFESEPKPTMTKNSGIAPNDQVSLGDAVELRTELNQLQWRSNGYMFAVVIFVITARFRLDSCCWLNRPHQA